MEVRIAKQWGAHPAIVNNAWGATMAVDDGSIFAAKGTSTRALELNEELLSSMLIVVGGAPLPALINSSLRAFLDELVVQRQFAHKRAGKFVPCGRCGCVPGCPD